MAQFYEVLGQSDKSNEQTFYNNVEDQSVQYIIAPDKSGSQYPTQQIVVTSGEQLMVVDGQSQQIVIDQSAVTYQGQTIQQSQVQQIPQVLQQQQQTQIQIPNQQFAVIQDGSVSNGAQQIYFMEGNASGLEQHIVQQAQVTQQPIILNHQLGQNNAQVRPINRAVTPNQVLSNVRSVVRQPLMQQQRSQIRVGVRPANTNQQRQMTNNQNIIRHATSNQASQLRQSNPSPNQQQLRLPNQIQLKQNVNQQQIRQANPMVRTMNPSQQFRPSQNIVQQMRQSNPNQIIRPGSPVPQIKLTTNQQAQNRLQNRIQKNPNTVNARFSGLVNLQLQQQQKILNQSSDAAVDDSDKSMDDQETISLPDGNVITVAAYKKMLVEQKSRSMLMTKSSTTSMTSNATTATNTTAGTANKKRSPATPRARQSPKKTTAVTRQIPANPNQPSLQQQQQQAAPSTTTTVNDPSRYAMMNQSQLSNNNNNPPLSAPQTSQQQNLLMAQQQLRQQQEQIQIRPSQANYVIQPPRQNQKPQKKRPLPAYIPSSQIQKIIEDTPISEEFSDSIRMLVLLENGEQRLITFTLPKEACTIQEILEQVNVPFQTNTNIQVTEANSNGINYIVTVGNVPPLGYDDEDSQPQTDREPCAAPPTPNPPSSVPQIASSQASPTSSPSQPQHPDSPCDNSRSQMEEEKPSSPEPAVKDIPKIIPGMLALCAACGYLSEDLAKCIRCRRKLPDNVKTIQATLRESNGQKKDMGQQQFQSSQNRNLPPGLLKPASPIKKKSTKSRILENESVQIISSDEEEDDGKPSKLSSNLLQKLGASVTISPITKEPSVTEIQRHAITVPTTFAASADKKPKADIASMKFRTVRIGSYRCIPSDKVLFDNTKVLMKVPHPEQEKGVVVIPFDKSQIVKVLASFNPALPVIFYYLNTESAKKIRQLLGMTIDGDYYYDPISVVDECYRRITFLPDEISENDKQCLQNIYGAMMDELNAKEANDILIKTCPKEVAKASLGLGGAFTEIKQLLYYPPEGRGRISINTEDYVCLAQDQFLNDVIIDFYLKYLVDHLPSDQQEKVHVFSTFFYKRLTTKPAKASRKSQPTELDPLLTPAQKRHARVKTWTKNVNLFEKDFIVVPINENAHWFLAIICFPGMEGCETWDGKPYKMQVNSRKKTKKVQIDSVGGSLSLTAIKSEKSEVPILCEDAPLSDKDEAEGDDSELDSDDSEEMPLSQNSNTSISSSSLASALAGTDSPGAFLQKIKAEPRPPIKQPCILIFDSLAGANRSRVVATLRDYLTCEHKAKLDKEKIYNKDIIKGANPKVPQQNNFTDCGLYVLQYVEHFFKAPITDYNMPIKQIQNWFEEITVTKKREDIAILIKSLMREYGKDLSLLPDITFPTFNGKIIEREFEDEEEDEEEDMHEDEDMEQPYTDEEIAHKSVSMSIVSNKRMNNSDEDMQLPLTDEEISNRIAAGVSISSNKKSNTSDEYMELPHTDEENAIKSGTMSNIDMNSSDDACSPLKPSVNLKTSDDFVVQSVLNPKPDLSEFPRQTNRDTLSILKAKRIIRHKTNGPEMKKHKVDD